MTKDTICRTPLDYSIEKICEHIGEHKSMKVLDENKGLKEGSESSDTKNCGKFFRKEWDSDKK